MVKRNAIATKLTKICTQTQKQAFDVAVIQAFSVADGDQIDLTVKCVLET